MPRLTDQQYRDRSSYLGATDIAALAGVDPYTSPFEVYLEKIGELDRRAAASTADLDRMERGHRLEDVALDWWAELEGVKLERVRRDVVHPRLPFVIVHPDARVKPWRGSRIVVEAKTAARPWDEIPRRVEAQVQMQIAATKAEAAKIVVLGFDGPPKGWDLARNDELIGALEELAVTAWDRIERRDPPPVDGSRGASKWLDRLFRDGPEVIADGSQAAAVAELLRIREEAKRLEARDAQLVNALKFSMGGASRMYAAGVGRILWTAPFASRSVAWSKVADEYRERWLEEKPAGDEREVLAAYLDEIRGKHETRTEGVRQFRVTPAKEATA